MSPEIKLAAAVVIIYDVYALGLVDRRSFAWLWDLIATVCGWFSNALGRISIEARLNYMGIVQEYS